MAKNPNTKKPRERLQTKRRKDEDRNVLVQLQGLRRLARGAKARANSLGYTLSLLRLAHAYAARLAGASEGGRDRGARTSQLSAHGRLEAPVLEIELENQLGAQDYP